MGKTKNAEDAKMINVYIMMSMFVNITIVAELVEMSVVLITKNSTPRKFLQNTVNEPK
jgi:hypothetical protein